MTDTLDLRGDPDNSPERYVSLGGPYGDIPIDFLSAIDYRARLRIAQLTVGEVYNAEHLLGVQYWMALKRHQPKAAGRCLAYLVSLKALPLERYRVFGKRSAYYLVL